MNAAHGPASHLISEDIIYIPCMQIKEKDFFASKRTDSWAV
jgi:hypothetical protein